MRRKPEPFHVTFVRDAELTRWLQTYGAQDSTAAAVARAQRGVISTEQLSILGISRHALRRRTRRGLISPVFRGVHLWGGGVEAPGAREAAAILACRHRAAIAGKSAGALWGICPPPDEVTVLQRGGGARSRPHLLVLRSVTLADDDVVRFCGLPVTTPLRTLYDLAARGYPRLESAASAAHANGQIDSAALADFAHTHRALPGGATLCRIAALEARGFTRSQNERRLRALCRQGGLPQPMANRRVRGGRWTSSGRSSGWCSRSTR